MSEPNAERPRFGGTGVVGPPPTMQDLSEKIVKYKRVCKAAVRLNDAYKAYAVQARSGGDELSAREGFWKAIVESLPEMQQALYAAGF